MGHSGGSYAHYYGPGFKFSCVQISKSPNSLLLFTDYTPHSTVHSPSSSCFLSSKAKQAAMSDNEERWESLPAEIPNHIKYIIICTSFSKTWKSKSKTQLSFPPISTTPITKAKTSSSSGWQKKKKKKDFFTYDFITNDNNKEVYALHNKNDDDPDADFHSTVNGALHWVAVKTNSDYKSHLFILVFDLGDEVFREILLPELPAYGNSIALF